MTRRIPFEEVDRWIERLAEGIEGGEWQSLTGGDIPVDVLDHGETFEVIADLPGFDRDAITLTLTEGLLRIEASREHSDPEPDFQYVLRERPTSGLERVVRIPEPVDESEASATYDEGLLRVELTKLEADGEGQQIDIE